MNFSSIHGAITLKPLSMLSIEDPYDGVDHVLLAATGDVLEQAVVALGEGLAAAGLHAEAQLGDELHKGVELLGVGFVVDTIHKRRSVLSTPSIPTLWFADIFGDGLVGQQHKLFDEPIGLFALLDIDTDGFGVLVELELHFLTLEVDGAVLVALAAQDCGQGVEPEDGFPDGRAVGHGVGLDDFLRLLVGHAAVAADDRLAHPGLEDFGGSVRSLTVAFAFGVHLHDDAEAEFVLVLTEGAYFVAELLGQHGVGAVDQVDAGAAFVGFAVDGAAGLHVVGDVGDVHPHLHVAVG